MRSLWLSILMLVCAHVALASPRMDGQQSELCDSRPVSGIPPRSDSAPTGSEFARSAQDLSGLARDRLIVDEILSGNVPAFLRRLVPVTLQAPAGAQPLAITVCVLPDYLALGSDSDFLLVPMGLAAALEIAGHYGFDLPTPRLVDAIYRASDVKLEPQPLPSGESMRSTAYIVRHDELIEAQREERSAAPGELTSGHKKDLVLTRLLWDRPGRVAIYGWHRASGEPIQPLSTVHGARYADYSHGVRLVSPTAYVNGLAKPLQEVLADPQLARLLSAEGPLPQLSDRLKSLLATLPPTTRLR